VEVQTEGGTMQKIRLNLGHIRLFSIALIIFYFVPGSSSGQEKRLDSLSISMTLINQKVGSSKILSQKSVALAEQKVTLAPGDNLEKLLISKGIFADGESIGIVYQLNPALDAKAIKTGVEVTVPFVKDKKQFKEEFDQGGVVALTLDKEKKQEFITVLKELESAATSVAKLQPQQFDSIVEKDMFTQTTKSIVDKMVNFKIVIKERTRPLNSEILQQMNSEARQMNAILNDIITSKRKVGKNDIETAMLISKDMDIKTNSLTEQKGIGELPSRWPEVLVTVKTIDVQKRKEVNNMRVYYVPQALWNYRDSEAKSADRLTSPTNMVLPEADYYIWAGKFDNDTPLTEIKTLEVRKIPGKETIELDLAVK
jgi:hypothetical protein